MPWGLKIIMAISTTPKTSMRMEPISRKTSGKSTSDRAPTTMPGILPMPPSTTAIRIVADCMNWKESGEMAVILAAKKHPATPANTAPIM